MSGRGRGRGRGRKTVATVATVATVTESDETINSEVTATTATTTTVATAVATAVEPVPKKRSSKKQFSVVAVVTPNSIEGNLQPESRKPLIAYLPIQSRDIIFHDTPIQYNPCPPTNVEPYDATMDNPFVEEAELLMPANSQSILDASMSIDKMAGAIGAIGAIATGSTTAAGSATATGSVTGSTTAAGSVAGSGLVAGSVVGSVATVGATVSVDNVPDYYKKATLLVQFQTSEEIRTIPDRVDTACFWCCHSFEWKPVVLPVRDQGEFIQVQGNFCCPECAMSYLFDAKQDSYTRWEQLSLLNRIYSTGEPVRPAPPKQILKLFGGPMSISDYRGLIRGGKLRVDIHLPPMVSLLATMDTKPIDFYDVSLTKNVMETVKERLAKAEEVLKLKRTKPLKAWESTLDACINLKVRN